MTIREAILSGTASAAEVHQGLGIRKAVADGLRAIDIFGAITELGVPLEFLKLDGLLGACVRVEDVTAGILVNSKPDLHMQRFTGGHELGHFVLEHEGTLDREIPLPGQTAGRDIREVEANAFATEFLMPKWLISAMAKRRNWWNRDKLTNPDVVYQLALRLAISYEATCWGLASQECIERATAENLSKVPPKTSKLRELGGTVLENPWADVWRLDPTDDGARIEAGADDLLILHLSERASAGYTWQTQMAVDHGFAIVGDSSELDRKVVGAEAQRRLVFRAPSSGLNVLVLEHRRAFEPKGKATGKFQIVVSTSGSRGAGPGAEQQRLQPSAG